MLTCPEYLTRVENALRKEEARADLYLAPRTKELIIDVVVSEAIECKAQEIADMPNTGCLFML